MKTVLRDIPDAPPALGPYSHGVLASGSFLFVSGQTPYNPATGKIERGTVAEQTRLVLDNVQRVLQAGGTSVEHVVSCRVYLSELTSENFQAMNAVYAEVFGSSLPARATVGVQLPGFDVEIECIAALPEKS